jgi:hypothetical protein
MCGDENAWMTLRPEAGAQDPSQASRQRQKLLDNH